MSMMKQTAKISELSVLKTGQQLPEFIVGKEWPAVSNKVKEEAAAEIHN